MMSYHALLTFTVLVTSILLAGAVNAADSSTPPATENGATATAETCDGRLVYVDDPSSVGDNYPIFMETRRELYVLKGSCFNLSGEEFRGTITFFPWSRAPQGFNGKLGVLIVKSIRTFTGPIQDRRIKLSRNRGWYLPQSAQPNTMSKVAAIDDVPIDTSITDWNSLYLHSPVPAPEQFTGLGVPWHAYASEDKSIYSTEWPDFWMLKDRDEFQNRIVTNYLIRYAINPIPTSTSAVSFYVATPDKLQRLDLYLYFNSDLARAYTFLFK